MPDVTSTAGLEAAAARKRYRLVFFGLLAALVLQLLFAVSFVGALHEPKPHGVDVGIVGPPQVVAAAQAQLRAVGLEPVVEPSPDALRQAIEKRELHGGLVVEASGASLLIASAGSFTTARFLEAAFGALAQSQKVRLTVTDVKPVDKGDSRGLTLFYAAVAWLFGGYLAATLVTLIAGPISRSQRVALYRVGALVAYAVVSGLLGAVIAGPALDAISGHFLAMAGVGAMLVLAAALATAGLQAGLGLPGTAVAMVVFIMIGNSGSGGAFDFDFLPGFWRALGPWLPTGAGLSALRGAVYFDGNGVAGPLLLLVSYALAGAAVMVAMGGRRGWVPELELAGGGAAAA
jgi:hypothetical protein